MNSFGYIDYFLFYKKIFNGKTNRVMFTKILNLFFKKIKEELYKGNIVNFPYRLGSLYIQKYKPKLKYHEGRGEYYLRTSTGIDFKATKQLWEKHPELKEKKQRVFYENKHTDGYQFKLTRTSFSNKFLQKVYNFKPVRSFKRDLAQEIFKDPYREFITG